MKIKMLKFKESISGRLMVRVLIVSAIIFMLTFTFFLRMAANKMREEATNHAHSELSNTIHQIDAILRSVEIAVENTAWIVPHRLSSQILFIASRRDCFRIMSLSMVAPLHLSLITLALKATTFHLIHIGQRMGK